MIRAGALVLAALGPAAAPSARDVLEVDGARYEGRILYADDETVILREERRDRTVERADVVAMEWSRDRLRALLTRAAAVPADAAGANLELSRFARSHGLEGEAALFAWRALLADPESAEAHAALGHERRGDRWQMRHDKRRYTDLGELREAAREWRHALELETLHFRLKTNLDLPDAVAAAIDLERFYLAFYDLFARDLLLYECTEPMYAQIHADAKSYPEPSSGAPGYFEAGTNVLYLNAAYGVERGYLVHEGTHQVVHNATEREKAFSGDLPAWVDEGLAEYAAASALRPPAVLRFDPGFPHAGHGALHGRSERPLSLSRVLALQGADFQNNTRRGEMYAQSYTLVHWALHADDGAHREAFFGFLRGCFQGRSSPSRFKKDLGLDRDFEETWQEYARGLAAGDR